MTTLPFAPLRPNKLGEIGLIFWAHTRTLLVGSPRIAWRMILSRNLERVATSTRSRRLIHFNSSGAYIPGPASTHADDDGTARYTLYV
jgi:hypothetical protein